MGNLLHKCWQGVEYAAKTVGHGIGVAAKEVGNFIIKHSKKILAGALIAVGAAICIFSGGLFAPIGAGLIGGGLSALAASFRVRLIDQFKEVRDHPFR